MSTSLERVLSLGRHSAVVAVCAMSLWGCESPLTSSTSPAPVGIAQESAALTSTSSAARTAQQLDRDLRRWVSQNGKLSEGVRIAAERRTAMRALMRAEPETAIELAMSPVERGALPQELQPSIERWRDGKGALDVVAGIGKDGTAPPLERFVRFDGEERAIQAAVYGRRMIDVSRTGLRLHGIELDGLVALSERTMRKLFPGERVLGSIERPVACPTSRRTASPSLVYDAAGDTYGFCVAAHAADYEGKLAGEEDAETLPASWSKGPKTVLFIRVDFSDRVGDPISLADAQTLINTHVNGFFVSSSYNLTSMSTTVTATLRMPQPSTFYSTNDNYAPLLSDARAAARTAGFDTLNYDLDVIGFVGIFGGWAGRGTVGGKGTWINGNFSTRVVAHELGHNYGVHHANFWNAGTSIIGPGSQSEYGNPFDVMGSTVGDFNAYFKKTYDWITTTQNQVVTTSGTYRIQALELPITSGLHSLQIPRTEDQQRRDYWVEFRQANTSNPSLMNGVSLNFGFPNMSSNGSHLLDVTPDGNTGLSGLIIGRTFADPLAGVFITPIGKGGTNPESIDVVVNLGQFPGNRAPTLTVMASSTTVASGASVTFTATAADADGDALAYAWDFDDGSFGPNAATATKALSGNRVFTVRCKVSDMKGGTVSRSVNVTVGAPTNFSLSGTVTVGGQPLEGVRITDGTRETFTVSNGSWTLNDVPAGSPSLSASKFDYTFTPGFAQPVTVSASQTGLDFTATQNGPYFIGGKVNWNGTGVAGVTVSNGTLTATTNSSGDYSLGPLPTGRYRLTATRPGWLFNPAIANGQVEVFGANVSNYQFYAAGGYLAGVITGSGITVAPTVTDGERTVTASNRGGGIGGSQGGGGGDGGTEWSFTLSNVPAGQWNLVASSPGVVLTPVFTNPVTVAANGGYASGFDFVATVGARYTITGTVKSGPTGIPGVTVSDGTRSSITDSLGRFVITGVPAGSFTVTPTRSGYTFVPANRAVTVSNANVANVNFDTSVVNSPPTISAISATPNPTTGPATLSVTAADDGGEANLVYRWELTSTYPVTFGAANNTNASKSMPVTLGSPAPFVFLVTVTDSGGLFTTRTITVNTQQVPTSVVTFPTTVSLAVNGNTSVSASLRDQFGSSMIGNAWVWSLSGAGTFTSNGNAATYIAPAAPGGPFQLTATHGAFSASAQITVVSADTPIITYAYGLPSPVTGTTTTLSVIATDDGGEPALVYTWSKLSGPGAVVFSLNGTNAAKSSTATFVQPGNYDFNVVALDATGKSASRTVSVVVISSPAVINITPNPATIPASSTQTFSASCVDQFGVVLASQPTVTWSATGGTINGAGLYTAGSTTGAYTVTATVVRPEAQPLTGTATVNISGVDTTPPTVSITAPTAGTMVSGMFNVTAMANDNVAVSRVEFYVGAAKVGERTSPPWVYALDAQNYSVGPQQLTARATDSSGNATTSSPVSITVVHPDTTPPVVSITSPTAGAMINAPATAVAMATDNVAVSSVAFELDGTVVVTLMMPPWTSNLSAPPGSHSLVAIATDSSGNTTRSAPVLFTFLAPPDAGTPDAGTPDAGPPTDAGTPTDGGTTVDAGPVDDGGVTDAGTTTDGGGGEVDGGEPDAGETNDAGLVADAGTQTDAGTTEPMPTVDAGNEPEPAIGGCGCTTGVDLSWALLGVGALALRRRTSRR